MKLLSRNISTVMCLFIALMTLTYVCDLYPYSHTRTQTLQSCDAHGQLELTNCGLCSVFCLTDQVATVLIR